MSPANGETKPTPTFQKSRRWLRWTGYVVGGLLSVVLLLASAGFAYEQIEERRDRLIGLDLQPFVKLPNCVAISAGADVQVGEHLMTEAQKMKNVWKNLGTSTFFRQTNCPGSEGRRLASGRRILA